MAVDAGVAVALDAGVDAPVVAAPVDEAPKRYFEWDADGDGALEPAEVALQEQAATVFADVTPEVVPEALDKRPKRKQLGVRSLSVARFRAMVAITRTKVLARLTSRIEAHSAARMITVSKVIAVCSLCGLFLLLLPLFMARRYPGKKVVLFKYSVLAAITFLVTVSLFGAVSLLHRGAHGALAEYTNPQLALAPGFCSGSATSSWPRSPRSPPWW